MPKIGMIEDKVIVHEFAKNSLSETHELEIFASAEDFLERGMGFIFDLVYLDLKLPKMSGLDLLKQTYKKGLEIKFVILSSYFSDEIIFECLENGAIGYILKSEVKDLMEPTNIFLSGGSVITPTIAFQIQRRFKKKTIPEMEVLSEREREILDEIIQGLTAGEVAEKFKLSIHTIRSQIKSIYHKLKVNNRVALYKRINP
jgi:DNA-binding NarL/FixJ family response regulator